MSKKRPTDEVMTVLTLLRLDAQRLYERIRYRELEYMQVFSMKRTREHFKDIFKNRYDSLSINELKLCGEEVIVGLDQFYTRVDELRWYLSHTEDMPGTVEDNVHFAIKEITECYDLLQLYISAELGLSEDEQREEVGLQTLAEDIPEWDSE